MKKRILCAMMTAALCAGMMAGCGASSDSGSDAAASDGQMSGMISVVSREDGSGTRGAFIELFGVEQEKDGQKVDMTTTEASITNNTSVMMTTVAGDINSIGYISLGSLDDSIKALKIDGTEASAENVANGSYKVSRPFLIVTKDEVSDVAKDFQSFIMGEEGQQIVEDEGYIKADAEAAAYESTKASGKVVVAGSSSVQPVMEKLKEAYEEENPNATIEVQQSDSTTGITSAAEGVCDIGMSSRALKDEEADLGLTATEIAKDGIAVIVNNENSISEMTSEQVKSIFTGEVTEWEEVQQ